jgi:hypothetical protein
MISLENPGKKDVASETLPSELSKKGLAEEDARADRLSRVRGIIEKILS